ncbi:hypothetical protein AXG93_673s1360 [Marchantia polymorpha subsp. ruderalis]|uniref:Uncharacterized protein n=1 Tax=Marchantia polymorpha subsp. ruderalis TaxID=1480154 RepID=A0A176WIV6_MARPO|nr:hypothetical protein AXG93_673s1360 [Marchantia polymorpha subsp. ruderalis]
MMREEGEAAPEAVWSGGWTAGASDVESCSLSSPSSCSRLRTVSTRGVEKGGFSRSFHVRLLGWCNRSEAPTGGGRPGGNIGGRGSLRTGSVDEANGKGRKRVKPSCSAGGTTDAC